MLVHATETYMVLGQTTAVHFSICSQLEFCPGAKSRAVSSLLVFFLSIQWAQNMQMIWQNLEYIKYIDQRCPDWTWWIWIILCVTCGIVCAGEKSFTSLWRMSAECRLAKLIELHGRRMVKGQTSCSKYHATKHLLDIVQSPKLQYTAWLHLDNNI